ncbi:MFS transporter, DHA2 family, multidrug resistance protein [Desulfovibrionales bacterium]
MAVMVPTFIEVLDTSVANVSLGHIQGSLSAGQDEVTWVLTSYLVANAVVIPMSSWLARLMGRKRYLLLSIAVFTISSFLCGAAGSLTQLICFRILQGIGGGGLQPMSQAILMETFPPRERGLAMAVFGMGVVVGPILGPLLGGWLTDHYSWRWIFYINLPAGLLAIFMCRHFMEDPIYQIRHQAGDTVDTVGLALLCLGLGAMQIVLDRGQQDNWFDSQGIVILSVVTIISLIALIVWELRHPLPVLDLRILKNRSFATGNLIMFFGFFILFGSIVLLPMYLQGLMGYTALLAGIVLGPGGLLAIIAMPVAGILTQRIDARFLLAFGILCNAWSLWYMSGYTLQIDLTAAITGRIIQGIGMPFFFVSLSFLTMASVPREKMNDASAIFSLLRNLGGSFGVTFITTFLTRRVQFHQNRLSDHLSIYDPNLSLRIVELKLALKQYFGEMYDTGQLAAELIYHKIQTEAAAIAFADVFFAQTILCLSLLAIIWIIRRPQIANPSL